MSCNDNNFYYSHSNNSSPSFNSECSIIQLPVKGLLDYDNLFTFLTAEFDLEVLVSDPCPSCHRRGGQCFNHGEFYCTIAEKENKKNKVVIVIAVGCAVIIFMIFVSFVIRHHYKKKYASSNLIAKNTYPDPSSRSEVDGGSVYFGVPVFSYSELLEATKNFDIEKELGDGGFGTVYHVKRLYEHNYRRVQQFMNEVKILTCLHHKNLVSLYGCTSCHSRELLLVYEYVPNGTVADHIHGNRATSGSLTWPTRMRIAIETASALAYLHASDIIHRDVKTNNILLDVNFCVKVADFGLSRLFPNDVTHVSTAPQGTPGYVDPEYHQCYQLTSKSDVYSFGVVLIELISSLLAVDIARQRHEINLANLAINKIQMCAFHELIDPHLGFESDNEVNRMTISVAELAFQCIQQDKEMRPSMDEVLEALKKIQSGEDAPEDRENAYDAAGILNVQLPASPDCDKVGLLKNKQLPPSPNAVTDNWTSSCSSPTEVFGSNHGQALHLQLKNRQWRWRNQSRSGGQRWSEAVVELFVELMASAGDRRTQARAREATRWRWLTGLVPLAGSSSRLPWVALNGGSWWLSRGGSHGLRLPRCCGCHGSLTGSMV
uniref:Protein kinase domain-containing protein n=1 Tax=Fagus sylvatica TaxID=28930 RepID=A0A2N9FL65_FAGSY